MGLQLGSPSARRHAQAAAFDNIGERYDQAFPHKEGQVVAGEWLIGQLASGARVLDAGCGTGVPTARKLQEAGLSVTGTDISAVMLALALPTWQSFGFELTAPRRDCRGATLSASPSGGGHPFPKELHHAPSHRRRGASLHASRALQRG